MTAYPLCTHFLVLGLFLSACGLAMSEVLLSAQQVLSARAFAFAVSVAVSWLVLDNLVLAADLARATQNTSTDCERELLRRLSLVNRRCDLLSARLDEEAALHRETAAKLDELQETRTDAMHWNMLASKAVALNNIQQITMRRRAVRRLCAVVKDSRSDSEMF